jgi:hypothetical protein
VTHQPEDDFESWFPTPTVYLQDEQVIGVVVSYGAYVSRVRYVKDGVSYEVFVENEDIMDGD